MFRTSGIGTVKPVLPCEALCPTPAEGVWLWHKVLVTALPSQEQTAERQEQPGQGRSSQARGGALSQPQLLSVHTTVSSSSWFSEGHPCASSTCLEQVLHCPKHRGLRSLVS